MIPLTEYLAKRYNFTTVQWEKFFQNEGGRLTNVLDGIELYTGHCERRDPLMFDAISLKTIGEIRVNSGGIETTFTQFIYSKFGVSIQKPNYCCLVHRAGYLSLDHYYPLEFVYVDKK